MLLTSATYTAAITDNQSTAASNVSWSLTTDTRDAKHIYSGQRAELMLSTSVLTVWQHQAPTTRRRRSALLLLLPPEKQLMLLDSLSFLSNLSVLREEYASWRSVLGSLE